MRDGNCLLTLARDDLDRLPHDMRQLIGEMLRKDYNHRPTCRDLLNNKIITSHVSSIQLSVFEVFSWLKSQENVRGVRIAGARASRRVAS